MRFLHKNSIINHQFFPRTILIDENFYPVISEYTVTIKTGLFVDYYSLKDVMYMGPEKYEVNECFESNVYTFGIICYQIITGKKPFSKTYRGKFYLLKDILNGMRPDLSIIKNDDISDFLSVCFNGTLRNRMNFQEIVDFITSERFYSFFKGLDHDLVKKYLSIYGNEFEDLAEKF